jgi:predicted Zn-dependent peptidase
MPGTNRPWGAVTAALVLLLAALPALAGDYRDLEKQVEEVTLPNGLHFLVLNRPEVPVFTFDTYVNAGSVDEVQGITGIAHILEHMAFKGTPEIGTKDYKAEQKAMAAEDAAFAALRAERLKGALADTARVRQLEKAFAEAKTAAQAFVVSNQFGQIVESNGGVGLNAGTGEDATNYYYSLPANRLELWAWLEGSRMANPVLREFYTEKDGPVTEERRMRTDNNPIGMLIEQFQNMAFSAHPYQHAGIGYMADLQNISRADCAEFYRTHYVGNNIVVSVVGGVTRAEVEKVARKHFAAVPGPAAVPPVVTAEPPQKGEKRIVVQHSSQPIVLVGFHKGGITDPDDSANDALASILGQGRSSRLYKSLVKEKKIAVQAGSFGGYPGTKYPNLMLIYAIPAKDVSAQQCEEALLAEIDRLVAGGVTAEELAGVKARARADFIRGLDSNQGLAQQLTYFQMLTGSWRNMFRQVEKIDAVTQDDVQRVARQVFQVSNRTVASIETTKGEGKAKGSAH